MAGACAGGGALGLHQGCFRDVGVAPGGEIGCTGHVPEVMHWFVLGRCTGGALGGLRGPRGLHWRCIAGFWRLGGCIGRVGGALGGALGMH